MAANDNKPVTRKQLKQALEPMKEKAKVTPIPNKVAPNAPSKVMATKPKPKPGATRVSPINTHLREMQAEAFKRAQEKKVWETLQKQSANNDGRNTI